MKKEQEKGYLNVEQASGLGVDVVWEKVQQYAVK